MFTFIWTSHQGAIGGIKIFKNLTSSSWYLIGLIGVCCKAVCCRALSLNNEGLSITSCLQSYTDYWLKENYLFLPALLSQDYVATTHRLFFTLFSGKQVRTKLAQAFNHWLNVPEDKLQVRNQPFKASKCSESPDVYCRRRFQEGEMTPCSFRIGNLFCNANRVFSQLSCS